MLARLLNGTGDRSDPRLTALFERAGKGEPSDALAPWSLRDLEHPEPGSFGVEFDDGDGHLVGYVRCASTSSAEHGPAWAFELVTHPFWAGRVEYEMLTVLYAHLLMLGGGEVTWWSSEPRTSALARATGFRPDVALCELTCLDDNLDLPGHSRPSERDAAGGRVRLVVGEDDHPLGSCWATAYDAGRRIEISSIRCQPGGSPGLVVSLASGALATLVAAPGRTVVASVDARDRSLISNLLAAGFTPHRQRLSHRSTLPTLPRS